MGLEPGVGVGDGRAVAGHGESAVAHGGDEAFADAEGGGELAAVEEVHGAVEGGGEGHGKK